MRHVHTSVSLPVKSCVTLLSPATLFHSHICLPCKDIFILVSWHAPPPLLQFDLRLPCAQNCLLLLSCVSPAFRFLSLLLTVHWLGYKCFRMFCLLYFTLVFLGVFFYNCILFFQKSLWFLFIVIYCNGQDCLISIQTKLKCESLIFKQVGFFYIWSTLLPQWQLLNYLSVTKRKMQCKRARLC